MLNKKLEDVRMKVAVKFGKQGVKNEVIRKNIWDT